LHEKTQAPDTHATVELATDVVQTPQLLPQWAASLSG